MKQYPEAYLDYLIFFHAERDYFECHEVMEAFWKEHPGDERSQTYVALIQIAVGLYHERRGNQAGAVKMIQSAARNMDAQHIGSLGLDAVQLQVLLAERVSLIQDSQPAYMEMNLPIADADLLAWCNQESAARGLTWQAASRMDDEALIHKHTLRDRTEVIQERERQQQIRKEKGGAQ
ncbi:DUF309 domain-containing protein [Paenibacillus aestuarii]|uniref:DUF309 domain-containing protein n=1 Tax=Paenibacillus aestuarii TaxID=516965 RepID=A0ABW0K4B1_9BACL|nr:DUF309 domain-containing protein [Paenibacillus aestuarii]